MQHIDSIRLSEKQKQQLITLKRKTGIENWNVLCRWALCISLAEPTIPPKENIPSDSNVEMTWRTFAGSEYRVYESIVLFRSKKDMMDYDIITFLKLHISRGLNILLKSTISIT
ncbi:DNA sulfur modification protein DndE [Salmonella enterica subsp. enterica serovar Newport]|uniref:DNA sulfur modification protein DndE n=3 Tax=Salmonella enterica TaxID=28901 RepID=A0A3U2ZX83_SALNE|nr:MULTISPECIES: DNA sulfur modification protein DndE [Enterobacteriaceae]EAA7578403.1 DNA sulfur modification protein DndE [Salmonella enterica subsp. enterica]EAM3039882.1 DNA sulfur modification protein DndE [Salmonella enterica]ECN0309749.1 DNA sulfur modification protein DndE [Salmonella enterica subsp. enterica serovar Typhi]EDV9371953.1 DNA sulfur modification protein DndE [Salmonella enterica subsp. enterica serovar Bovismorbificans]ALP99796.1 DNA sulfur modification protein DndE [Salm